MLLLFGKCFICGQRVCTTTLLVLLNDFVWGSQPSPSRYHPSVSFYFVLWSGTNKSTSCPSMGCATIAELTFFAHQNKYLHICISSVWEKYQSMLFEFQQDKRDLIIGGDDTADSPGHSSKFESYKKKRS